jgi:hypothetical protein
MKAICEGRTTRHDVVQQNLEQYRAVFNRTAQQINVLKSVSQCNITPTAGTLLCSRVAYVRYTRRSENTCWARRIRAEAYSTPSRHMERDARHHAEDPTRVFACLFSGHDSVAGPLFKRTAKSARFVSGKEPRAR